jgi:HEAT repeat protein
LLKALVAPDDKLRAYAAMALGGIGDKAERAIPDLVKLISDRKEQPDVRIEAATALSRIGEVPAARKAVPQLVNVLQDANDNAFVWQGKEGSVKVLVRERVIWSLRVHNARLRDFPEVLAAFTKILSEPRQAGIKMLYYDSAYMLGMLKGPEAPPKTMDELGEFLKDDSIQIYVGKEAKSVGGGAESPADLKVQETGMGDGRIMAVQALGRIGARVADRKDIVRQLQAIERDARLWGRLRTETKELLKELGR